MLGLLGGAMDPLRVRVAHGERLFHHHVDVPGGRGLDDRRMIEGVGERGDGVGLGAVDHRREIGEERGLGELVGRAVFAQERGVGVEDADNLDVLASLRAAQEAADVPVHEAGDRQPERRWLLRSRQRQGNHQ